MARRGFTAEMIEAQLSAEGHRLADVRGVLSTVTVAKTFEVPAGEETKSRRRLRLFGLSLIGVGLVLGLRSVDSTSVWMGGFNIVLGLGFIGRASM